MRPWRGGSVHRTAGLVDEPLWYKDAVIYELRVRSFYDSNGDGIGDFAGLASKLDYLQDLGVTALWLLPFYPSPLKDDGYDIAEYTEVHPDVGTIADFQKFLAEAHRRGLRVITELVLNHTSDQHPWFQRARRAPKGSAERDFYVWSDSPERYRDARIIFKDFEPSNWSWDPVAKQYFWHRFFAHQPDLNFRNPAVHEAVLSVVDFWLEMGVDGLRLDAVPYLYEEEGTNCENLPQTHDFLRALRTHIDGKFKNRMLLAEANQWPEDAAAYFGKGDECHMNFHFPIMPRMFMAIHMEDRLPIIDILAQTPQLPENCQWAIFLRNHDELTLEMVTDEEREYMYRAYAAESEMRINLGIRRRLAPLVGNDRRKMELLNGLLCSLPGTPVLYYGDEIGMGDNVFLGDRNGVRTPMQWTMDRNAGFSRGNPQRLILPVVIDPEYHYESLNVENQQNNPNSLLWWMKRIVAIRKRFQAFGRGSIEFLNPSNPRVLAFIRQYGPETILVVANLSRSVQYVELDLSKLKGMTPVEVFGHTEFPPIGELPYLLTLGAHAFYWFSIEAHAAAEEQARASLVEPPSIVCKDTGGGALACLTGEDRSMVEEILPGYLERRHWGREGRAIAAAHIVEAIPLREAPRPLTLTFVRVEYAVGDPETFVVPLAFTTDTSGEGRPPAQAIIAGVRAPAGAQGILFDGLEDPACMRALLGAVVLRQRARGENGELAAGAIAGATIGDDALLLDPRRVGAEHANACLQYGDRYVLKVFRRLEEGTSPEVEIGRYMGERGSALTPRLLGAIEYRPARDRGSAGAIAAASRRGEPMTVAVLHAYVPNEGTAWRQALEALRRYYERIVTTSRDLPSPTTPPGSVLDRVGLDAPAAVRERMGAYLESAGLLGRRTGELHLALGAAPPEDLAFARDPYSALDRRSKYQSLRNTCAKVLRMLRASLAVVPQPSRAEAEAVLAHEGSIYKRFDPLLTQRMSPMRVRSHGDFHLEQVLWTGKDYVIFDFDGGHDLPFSERKRKRSPLRDVASMLRSFDYAAFSALLDPGTVRESDRALLEPWARAWAAWSSEAFLRAYLKTLHGSGLLPEERPHLRVLLDAFVLEKMLLELRWELEARSERVAIPLHGLARMLSEEGQPA